ncbi:unnamed protein product [Cyprideis torosa]|uniref:Uncharacterized protein n=1 Tax=Cyprideis torosa TaxID=163714 RepID=A0A7R8W8I3_9CRUS|nr:unnamed protein product [Cyprideis torosa]CAG0888664.1 unnamed protein product [Cyprideis torosa]
MGLGGIGAPGGGFPFGHYAAGFPPQGPMFSPFGNPFALNDQLSKLSHLQPGGGFGSQPQGSSGFGSQPQGSLGFGSQPQQPAFGSQQQQGSSVSSVFTSQTAAGGVNGGSGLGGSSVITGSSQSSLLTPALFTPEDFQRLSPRQQAMVPQVMSILGSLVQSIASTMPAESANNAYLLNLYNRQGGTDIMTMTAMLLNNLLQQLANAIGAGGGAGGAAPSQRGQSVYVDDAILVPVPGLNARCLGNGEYCGCPIGMFMRQSDGMCMLHLYVGGPTSRTSASYQKADPEATPEATGEGTTKVKKEAVTDKP